MGPRPMNSERVLRHDSEVHRVQETPAVGCIAQVRGKFSRQSAARVSDLCTWASSQT